ncbi:hypothetical protein LJC09_01335 [Desulfovibrio sp. OttesenSCG-928-F20]|nr:hypothetical protein [Desulfovibrio sp. OttesenSCG-928-F20]
MAQTLLRYQEKQSPRRSPKDRMKDRQTAELILAIIAPLGGGAKSLVDILKDKLKAPPYEYDEVEVIELSEIIAEQAKIRKYDEPEPHEQLIDLPPLSERAKRSNRLQKWGNRLRKENEPDFLAKQVIRKIAVYRKEKEKEKGVSPGEPLRVAHIIRSLKNEYELELLRKLYGNMLIAIAVSAGAEQQIINFFDIQPKGKERTQEDVAARKKYELEFSRLANIDQYEGIDHGQRVRKVFYQADLFLNNGPKLDADLNKFLELLFGVHIHHPNIDESMIFKAFAASLQSTCLSRQVGAVIANEHGELISIGWNDIPGCNGGLAQAANELEYKASCKFKQKCNSQDAIDELKSFLLSRLKELNIVKGKTEAIKEENINLFKDILDKSEISSLTEFSRAVHAEMEAILHAARNRSGNLRKATLYVTTFPCENCVKHILTAGIKKIIYIEPYPKSRALDFYGEFIKTEDDKEDCMKLIFEQFTGISPAMYSRYFKMHTERKSVKGKTLPPTKKPLPLTNVYMDNFARYESEIADELIEQEKGLIDEY